MHHLDDGYYQVDDGNDSMYDSERRRTSLINSIEKTTEILNQYMEGSKKNNQAEIAYNSKKTSKLNRSINFSNAINLMNDSGVSGEKAFVSAFAT